jgi:hypothetical protein
MSETAGLLIGFLLTLFIYSYILGDNPLYRLAVHLLVGVSAAYAAVVVTRQILVPIYEQMRADPTNPTSLLWFVPIALGLLLLLKRLPGVAWMGNSTMALLVGIGAAVALTGALTGTLWPQVTAVNTENPLLGLLVAFLTVCTLLTFQFTGGMNSRGEWIRPFWQRGVAQVGQAVLLITFGALFAGALNTSLILLIERVSYFLNGIRLP